MGKQAPPLTDFLLARITEDEGMPWDLAGVALAVDGADRVVGQAERAALRAEEGRWEARVLAECDAKRRIVEEYESLMGTALARTGDLAMSGALLALHGVVKILALPYADHPDYRQEWKP